MQIFIYCKATSFAVNKYMHIVASVGFLFTLNYDEQNHELNIYIYSSVTVCYFGVTDFGKGGFDFFEQHSDREIVNEFNSVCYIKE